jgi:hypothetical protein
MSLPDSNAIVEAYLKTDVALHALVGDSIYVGSLPEKATLPAVTFQTRGGTANPHIPDLPNPSKQFKTWAKHTEAGGVETDGRITARQVYRALYDALQGKQFIKVTMPDTTTRYILSAVEEVQGQDLEDPEVPGYFSVLTFFSIIVR